MLVKVTKEILEESKMCGLDARSNSENCALACAVREIFPGAFVGVDHDNDAVIGGLPIAGMFIKIPNGLDFIRSFDNASPKERVAMQPISFEIEVPRKLINKIGIEEVTRILSESKTLELVGETIGEN